MTHSKPKRRLPPASLLSRLILGTSAVVGLGSWLAVEQIESYEDARAEELQQEQTSALASQLRAEAAALGSVLDGDSHETLAQVYGPMELDTWGRSPRELQDFRDEMVAEAKRLNIEADITTYRIKSQEKLVVHARSNELRPDALQEFFSSAPEPTGWAGDAPYLPDMELTLVPHQPVSVQLNGEEGPVLTAFAPIENHSGELKGFVRLDREAPEVLSRADERVSALLPLVGGGALLLFVCIIGCSSTLRRDLSKLKERIGALGKGQDGDAISPTLSDLHEVLKQADDSAEAMSRRLQRELSSRDELESRLRDAELGLCPSRRAHREQFTKAAANIQASVSVDRSRFVPGTLVDLTLEEAIFSLPAGGAVDLAPGFPAHIRIQSPGDDQVADFVVETLNRASVGKVSLVRLRIANPANLRSLPRELRHLVDNRQTVRVQPNPRNPVIARVAFNRGREERGARIMDLSAEGAGLTVRADLWKLSEWGASVELRLILPDSEQTIRLPARVTHANRSAGKVRVGLQFELARVGNSPQYKKLLDYLTARQAEIRSQLEVGKSNRSSARQPA